MEEILDNKSEEDKQFELTKNWKDLLIVIPFFLMLSGGLFLWFGIEMELDFHDPYFPVLLTAFDEIKLFVLLILTPLSIIFSAILLLLKKRTGWIASITSFVLMACLPAFFALFIFGDGYEWLMFVSLLQFGMAVLLLSPEYRKHFKFRAEILGLVLGFPIIYLIIMFYEWVQILLT